MPTLFEYALLILFLLVIVLIFLYKKTKNENERLFHQLQIVASSKHSLSAKYGKMTEQFLPFLDKYPYDEQRFRFIGSPIDGVQFEKDKIVLVEFKTGNAQLSLRQKEIRDLVNKGKVEFREFRI